MGMFDTLIINSSQLPISDQERYNLKDVWFQTKDLECLLDEYEITDRGELLYTVFGESRSDKQSPRKIDFSGRISFYGYGDIGGWYEFDAHFKDGKLINIFKLKP